MVEFFHKLSDYFSGIFISNNDFQGLNKFNSFAKDKKVFVITYYVSLIVLSIISIIIGLVLFSVADNEPVNDRVYNSIAIFLSTSGTLFTLTLAYCFANRLKQ